MEGFDDGDKAFYVDKKLAEAYYDYLVASGQTVLAQRMANGTMNLTYKGIESCGEAMGYLFCKALNGGTQAHAVILTHKGNFLYGADSAYGAPNTGEVVRMW